MIAIIGIGCRFPGGANGPGQFWRLLRDGVDAISEVPLDRWSLRKFYHPDPAVPGKVYARWGGFIRGIDQFDAAFFGITPREASRMDPQQRFLLEVSYEAIEDAGLSLETLAGSRTGVFMGISTYEYGSMQGKPTEHRFINGYTGLGGSLSVAAARISFAFDLKGPSMAVDTACSSSLVGMHLACQSIENDDCACALVGGVNLMLTTTQTEGFCKASMLSPDGRCKAFDASANGYVRAEGAGVVILKPLDQALKEGDQIYAVVRATGVNQDGHSSSIAVPERQAQEKLLREVYRRAGVDPKTVQYVEAHGTGTAVGDPTEACAIGAVLGSHRDDRPPCYIGSVKTNIGHLEAGAGIAGIIKTALILKHGEIPASLHFKEANPKIPLEELGLRVVDKLESWPANGDATRIAGVNSFGFGGTNAHVVLQNASRIDQPQVEHSSTPRASLLLISARSRESLKALAQSYAQSLRDGSLADASLPDVCRAALHYRSHHDFRLAISARSRAEAVDSLGAFVNGENRPTMSSGRRSASGKSKVGFIFSGMGPQWWAMGRELIQEEPVFRQSIERCSELLNQHADWSLMEILLAGKETSRIQETRFTQPAIFSLQIGLAALWDSWGVKPDAIVGHSVGEVAAAYVAGALSLEDAIKVIYHRSRLQHTTEGQGRMLAVALSSEEAQRLLVGNEERVSVAANNAPKSVTLSGDPELLGEINQDLEQQGTFARFLNVRVPYHSPAMDPLRTELLDSLHGIRPRNTKIPLVSTALGAMVQGCELDADYWWKNVRNPVLFADAMAKLIELGCNLFLEVSAHPVLSPSIKGCLSAAKSDALVIHSLRREEPECASILGNLGRFYAVGYSMDLNHLYPKPSFRLPLPRYPWQHETHWIESDESRNARIGVNWHPLLGEPMATARRTWHNVLDSRTPTWLGDHRLQGTVVFPAAAFVEMGLAAARASLGDGPIVLEEFEILRAMTLKENEASSLQLTLEDDSSSFDIQSRLQEGDSSWTSHVNGRMRVDPDMPAPPAITPDSLLKRCPGELAAKKFYTTLREMGLDYGATFQTVETIRLGKLEGVFKIRGVSSSNGAADYLLPPPILDGCFQVPAAMVKSGGQHGPFLPVYLRKLTWHAKPNSDVWCHARQTKRTDHSIEFDIHVFDESGSIIAEILGARWQAVAGPPSVFNNSTETYLHRYHWTRKNAEDNAKFAASRPFVSAPSDMARALHPVVEQLSRELDRKEYHEVATRELNELSLAFTLSAMKQLGFTMQAGQRFSESNLREALKIPRSCRTVLHRLLEFLQRTEVLRKKGDEWELVSIPDLNPPGQYWRDLIRRRPGYLSELMLIHRYGSGLADLLRDKTDELDLLFPDETTTTVDHLLQDAPSSRIYHLLIQEALASALKGVPDDQVVRILELGSGRGRTGLLVHPQSLGCRLHHVFAFASVELEGRRPRPGKNSTVECLTIDPGRNLLDQGLPGSTFDVVILPDGANGCHARPTFLTEIRQLLAPGGLLIVLGSTGWPAWMNLMLAPVLAAPISPTSSADDPDSASSVQQVRQGLLTAGFVDVEELVEPFPAPGPTLFLGRNEKGPDAATGSEKNESPDTSDRERSGAWLIFSERTKLCLEIVEGLRQRGHSTILVEPGSAFEQQGEGVFTIRPEVQDDMRRLLDALTGAGQHFRGILHLWSLLMSPPDNSCKGSMLMRDQNLGCLSVLHLVQALEETKCMDMEKMLLVTRGSQSIGPTSATSLASTPLWGFARVLMNEKPTLKVHLIDLDPDPEAAEAAHLLDELFRSDGEDEVAYRSGNRHVHRLTALSSAEFATSEWRANGEADSSKWAVHLDSRTPGMIESLRFSSGSRPKPGPHEVEIKVEAAALNFKDLAKAMGLLGDETLTGTASGWTLGLECAGKVTSVGRDVLNFQVGDEVYGFARRALGSHAIANTGLIGRLPEFMKPEEAATLITVAMTAHYALNYLARITRGEQVLIHAAAGGVGFAAIQLAHQVGATVIATAGNSEKREFLRALGVRQVFDSRSVAFADEIRDLTNGRGVDVVLNSLSGEMMVKSIGCLASFGRFVEIGKRDIEQNHKLGLRPFQNNLSFFAADLDRLAVEKPLLAAAVCNEVMEMIRKKTLAPLPYRVFSAPQAVEAFRHMAKAKHIGKIVISMKGVEKLSAPPELPLTLRSDATYLVTGGLSGFGLATARWLEEIGARHLVLASRSGDSTEEAKSAAAEMVANGVEVVVEKTDVTDESAVKRMIGNIQHSMPALRGIIHCAMVLDDGIAIRQTAERFGRVLAPKMVGAWNLHQMTLGTDLDFFVMFSSVSSLVGNPGQANYAAANAFLDELCHYRKSLGLPATTVNWGAIADVGVVARSNELQQYFSRLGLVPFPPDRGLSILGQLIQHGVVQSAVIPPSDLGRWIHFFPTGSSPRYSRIVTATSGLGNESSGGVEANILNRLLGTDADSGYQILQDHLRQAVAAVLGVSPDKFDVERPLIEMGIDSLMSVEIVTLIQSDLGINVAPVKFMEGISLAGLSVYIVDQLMERNPSAKEKKAA